MTLASKDRDDNARRTAGTAQPYTTAAPGWLNAVRARLGLAPGATLRDTIEDALKESLDGTTFSAAEREMLQRTLRFGTLRVDDIMVPRSDIIAIDESEPIAALLQMFDDAGVSRIPLYRETLDDPRGMVHIKDLMRFLMGDASPRDDGAAELGLIDLTRADVTRPITGARLRRPMLYVPPSMPVMNLLIRMQSTRIHMALIVDEYGGTDGLVTIEDLVEQVVGEIEDEHDVAEAANISEDVKNGLVAQARTPVAELEARLGLKLLTPEETQEIDTLGGLVFSIVGRVPARGEVVRHPSGLEFEVLEADPRRVKTLKIHGLGAPQSSTEPAKAPPTAAEARDTQASETRDAREATSTPGKAAE